MKRDTHLQPRKLPKQLRAQQTVDAIFEAAVQVLDRQDQEPSVQTVADRAGVSIGSLYQYFPSKEALVGALIQQHLAQQVRAVDVALQAAASFPAERAVELLIDTLVSSKTTRIKIERAFLRYFVRVGDLDQLTAMDTEMTALVARFIASRGTEVRPIDPDLAAFLITNALRSAILLTILQNPDRLQHAAFKAELAQLVIRFLKP